MAEDDKEEPKHFTLVTSEKESSYGPQHYKQNGINILEKVFDITEISKLQRKAWNAIVFGKTSTQNNLEQSNGPCASYAAVGTCWDNCRPLSASMFL
jgi:hypothetical protein